ncbi:MAG: hypothetical protein AB7V62_14490 [Thermoleophilia bacterium]
MTAGGPFGESVPDGVMPCLLFTPRAPADGPRPLIVFLHGVGERGHTDETLDRLRVHSLPYLATEGALPDVAGGPFPFIVACPQTAGGWGDETDRIERLIDALAERHGADRGRVYVTGISLGSVGTWQVAEAVPRIAAIAPISWQPPDSARDLDVPAWIAVGAQDRHADVAAIEADAARRGGEPRTVLRVDPDGTHVGGYWNHVYGQAELYEWMLRWSA